MKALLRALALLLLLSPGSSLAQNLVTNGDFENGFDGWMQVENVSISDGVLKADDPDTTRYGYVWREFDLEYGRNTIEFWIRPESESYFTAFETLENWQDPEPIVFNTRLLMTDKWIQYWAADARELIEEPLLLNVWNKVTIIVDSTGLTQDFYINDTLKTSLTSTFQTASEHLLVGDLSLTGMWGTVSFDDIFITPGILTDRAPRLQDDRLELDLPVSGVLSGSMNVLLNDSDPNGDPLTVTSFDTPSSGDFVWSADGSVTFELSEWDAADTLRHVLEYTVSDGALSATATLTISYAGGVPVAVGDRYVDSGTMPKFFPVLRNDVVPPGASVEITIDTPPQHGRILSVEPDGIWYQKNDGFEGEDEITYELTTTNALGKKIQTIAPILLTALLCACGFLEDEWPDPPECNNTARFVPDPLRLLLSNKSGTSPMPADSLDIDLVLQARDQLLRTTEVGLALVEDFVLNSPEILQLVLFDRSELRDRAVSTMAILQGPARNLLEGDGTRVITQAEMDSVSAFFEAVSAGVSDDLNEILQSHLAQLGPFDQYVGMTASEAFESIGGQAGTDIEDESPGTLGDFGLEPNFPNPFVTATQIHYTLERPVEVALAIYDIRGREVRALVTGEQKQGVQSVTWDGLNNSGIAVPPGTYFARLTTPDYSQARKMVRVR